MRCRSIMCISTDECEPVNEQPLYVQRSVPGWYQEPIGAGGGRDLEKDVLPWGRYVDGFVRPNCAGGTWPHPGC